MGGGGSTAQWDGRWSLDEVTVTPPYWEGTPRSNCAHPPSSKVTRAAPLSPVPKAQTSAASWPGKPLSTQGASHLRKGDGARREGDGIRV